jgi:hypothetical protein
LATDRVLPGFLKHQIGSKTEPRLAVLVTTAIAVGIVWAGDLNFVATIITMFFLATYGSMNLAAGIEKFIGNPSYRPKFNLPWVFSIAGALGCFAAMLLINVPATLVVMAVVFITFLALERRALRTEFGDVRNGMWATIARHSLLKLESAPRRSKNWRPNVVVFTGQPHNREHLVEAGDWLTRGQGVVSFVEILVGDIGELAMTGKRDEHREQIAQFIADAGLAAFAECQIAHNFFDGALTVVQAHGLAGLEPNTVLMGLSDTPEGMAKQQELVPPLTALGKSVLLLSYDHERGYGDRARIDVWWGGRSRNGELMLLLAHIVRSHRAWGGAKVRLLQIVKDESKMDATRAMLEKLLEDVRVRATPKPVLMKPGESVRDTIARTSAEADLTIIGMQMPGRDDAVLAAQRVQELTEPLGSMLLVRSAETSDVLSGDTVMIEALPPRD